MAVQKKKSGQTAKAKAKAKKTTPPKRTKTAPAKKAPKTKRVKATSAKKIQSKAGSPNQSMDDSLNAAITQLNALLHLFMEIVGLYNQLTPKERERLISAGVRNYGFIEKVRDIARDNPTYLPPNFDVEQFSADLESFDRVRQFFLLSEKQQTIASDKMLLMSNVLYRESLRVYNTLREQSRAGVIGARDLFNALEPYFKRKKVSERGPTIEEELHRARGIIKGTTQGEMLLKNIKAKKTGGVHEVIEDIKKDRAAGKETETFNDK
jgi:hypothetical protein